MQKLIIPVACIAIASLALYSYSLSKSLEEVKKSGLIYSDYYLSPVNKIDRQEVVEMVRNYYTNQYKALHDTASPSKLTLPANCSVDSRAVFFNLDTLKKLIYYIEKGSKGFSDKDKKNLGLNVYFASYPKSFHKTTIGYDYSLGHTVTYDYTNRHTLIFIPSVFDNTEQIAKDIDLNANLTNISTNPVYLDSSFFKTNPNSRVLAKTMFAGSVGTSSMMSQSSMAAQNHGTSIPPPPKTQGKTGNALLDITTY